MQERSATFSLVKGELISRSAAIKSEGMSSPSPLEDFPDQSEADGDFHVGSAGQPKIRIGAGDGLVRADVGKIGPCPPSATACIFLNFRAYSTGESHVSRKSAPKESRKSASSSCMKEARQGRTPFGWPFSTARRQRAQKPGEAEISTAAEPHGTGSAGFGPQLP